MTLTYDETQTIISALWHYHLDKYHAVTDYYKVVEERVEVEEGIYMYPCPLQPVYLDEDAYAVTYDRQLVWFYYFDENDEFILDNEDMPPEILPEGEYTRREGTVYYDFRETIPTIPQDYEGDTSLANVLTELGDYEWKRDTAGGGGVHG